MAANMIKITDADFADKKDFINVQCMQYNAAHFYHHHNLPHGWDAFNGLKCEDVLNLKLRFSQKYDRYMAQTMAHGFYH